MLQNSFGAQSTLEVGGREYEIFRLDALQHRFDVARLPFSLKVLLENLLRSEGNGSVGAAEHGDRLYARAGAHAGLHRSTRRG